MRHLQTLVFTVFLTIAMAAIASTSPTTPNRESDRVDLLQHLEQNQQAWVRQQAGPARSHQKLPLRVGIMPEVTTTPTSGIPGPSTWVGRENILWGTFKGGVGDLFTLSFDFGDGTFDGWSVDTAPDSRYIPVRHTYTQPGTYTFRFEVINHQTFDVTESAEVQIVVTDVLANLSPADAIHVRVQAAIEDGLRYLHVIQQPDGHWLRSGDAMAVWAMQARGHDRRFGIEEDPYADTIELFWSSVFNDLVRIDIPIQAAGDPDSNGNDYGLFIPECDDAYAHGLLVTALATVDDLSEVVPVGPEAGRTLAEVLQDLVDSTVFSQGDAGTYRGGWMYCVNCPEYGTSDNSAVQWAVQGLAAAEARGATVPAFVRTELDLWTLSTHKPNSGFGYLGNEFINIARSASGLFQMAWLGYPVSAPQIQQTVGWLPTTWASVNEHLDGNYYAALAVKKGLEAFGTNFEVVGGHDWQAEYNQVLVDDPQNDYDGVGGVTGNEHIEQIHSTDNLLDGRWKSFNWLYSNDDYLATAAATLILQEGILPTASIQGVKYWDQDANGVRNGPELGLQGWTITATNAAGDVVATDVTDLQGQYTLVVPAGTFEVAEEGQLDWVPISPPTGAQSVSMGFGATQTGVDFGNYVCGGGAKNHPFYCSSPTVTTYWNSQTTKIRSMTICNDDNVAHNYAWSVSPYDPGQYNCSGPPVTDLSPRGGNIVVPAGECVQIPVTITLPPGLEVGDRSCYFFSVVNLDTGDCCRFLHQVRRASTWWTDIPVGGGVLLVPATSTAVFEISHGDPTPLPLDYTAVALGPDGSTPSSNIHVGGQAPADSLFGSVMVNPGTTTVLEIPVEFLQPEPGSVSHLILLVDDNGDGIREPVASVRLQSVGAPTAVEDLERSSVLGLRASPNPFGRVTSVRLALGREQMVSVKVYNLQGRLVRSLQEGVLPVGIHAFAWDGRDGVGASVGSGIYLVRAVTQGQDVTTRVVRLR